MWWLPQVGDIPYPFQCSFRKSLQLALGTEKTILNYFVAVCTICSNSNATEANLDLSKSHVLLKSTEVGMNRRSQLTSSWKTGESGAPSFSETDELFTLIRGVFLHAGMLNLLCVAILWDQKPKGHSKDAFWIGATGHLNVVTACSLV